MQYFPGHTWYPSEVIFVLMPIFCDCSVRHKSNGAMRVSVYLLCSPLLHLAVHGMQGYEFSAEPGKGK